MSWKWLRLLESMVRQMSKTSKSGKVVQNLAEVIKLTGLKSGMTISFHHHFRNGDYIMNMVLDAVSKAGLKNMKVSASAIFDIQSPIIDHIKNKVVTDISTNYMSKTVGEAISHGIMEHPVRFRSHGGRPAAIDSGR